MDLTPGKLPEAAVSLLAWTFGDEDRAMARNDSCKTGIAVGFMPRPTSGPRLGREPRQGLSRFGACWLRDVNLRGSLRSGRRA